MKNKATESRENLVYKSENMETLLKECLVYIGVLRTQTRHPTDCKSDLEHRIERVIEEDTMDEGELDIGKVGLTAPQIDCLSQIVQADNKQNPVWDGQIIGSKVGRELEDKDLVHHVHGYWIPTLDGKKVWKHIKNTVKRKIK